MSPYALNDAPNSHGMVPTCISHIGKVIDNLHMQWMGIWISHHVVTTTLVGHSFRNSAEIFVCWWVKNEPLCIGWGSKPTWNGSHIPSIHIQGVWQLSYAVDGDMDPSSSHSHHTCRPRFGKSAEILGHCLELNEAFVQWLRLQTHMEWFPHPLHTYTRRLTSFICSGWW